MLTESGLTQIHVNSMIAYKTGINIGTKFVYFIFSGSPTRFLALDADSLPSPIYATSQWLTGMIDWHMKVKDMTRTSHLILYSKSKSLTLTTSINIKLLQTVITWLPSGDCMASSFDLPCITQRFQNNCRISHHTALPMTIGHSTNPKTLTLTLSLTLLWLNSLQWSQEFFFF